MEIETDYTTLTDAVAAKVWEEMNMAAGNIDVAPFEEQDDMIKFNLRSQVLTFVTIIVPVVKVQAENAVKDKMIAIINESHDAGHDDAFTLLALTAHLSDDD